MRILRGCSRIGQVFAAGLGIAALVSAVSWAAGGARSSAPALAAKPASPSASTCDGPPFHEFDFWVGTWQVYDLDTHRLVAFDRVEKREAGCVLEEHLHFLSNLYRRPGVVRRLAGISISRFDGEQWLQMWADNQWGAIALRGVATAPGELTFETIIPSRGRDVRLVYERLADGDVRMQQYIAPKGSGQWVRYGNLLYRRNR